ncbi:uncharacterized protein [Penaeus vannamei]|uniref:uncharacterized protein n=1 Tax=Penaeus vannamei TaxID=6689 RepID=UPI00387F937A
MTYDITSKTNSYVSLGQGLNVPQTDKLLILGDFNARVGRDSETWGHVLGQHGHDKWYNTWCHPRSKQWHLLDYVLVRRDDLKDVCSTCVMRGADCDTDHLLAEAVSSDSHWNNLRKAVYSAAKETLGHPQGHHEDWFEDNDKEIHNLLAEVCQCRQRVLSGQATHQATNKLKAAKAQLQTAIRKMKNNWWLDKTAELQDYADAGNSKAFFDGLKVVYGPRQSGSNPVLSADGLQLHYTTSDILSRWREHFQGLLNRPSTVDNSAISRLNQHPTCSDLDIPPTEGGHALHHELLFLFQTYWEACSLPQDFRDATIITLFKHVLLESQSGLRRGRGAIDMIFAFRQLQEKAMEQNMPLYAVFIDFTKVFDNVDRDALWHVLAKCGCPPKLLTIVKAFHIGMKATVSISGNNSDTFEVLHSVKQGCVLAPVLFAMYLAAMLENMPSNLNKGIFICTHTDSGLFNLSRLRSHRKILMQCICELLYADDSALVAHSIEDIQEITDAFAKSSAEFGLTINTQKTEVLYQPPPGQPHVPTNVLFNYLDAELDCCIKFASATFARLKDQVWSQKDLKRSTKMRVYRAVVMPTLLYSAETYTLYRGHIHRLEVFHQRHLWTILGVSWKDRVMNVEVLQRSGMPSIESWFTHSFAGWATYSGCLIRASPSIGNWEELAEDRQKWRAEIRAGAGRVYGTWKTLEAGRRERRHGATQAREANAAGASSD